MKETNNKKKELLRDVVIGTATLFMIGVVYSFLGGFAMSLIVGLTDLSPETLALVRYIVDHVVQAAWLLTIIVMGIKSVLESTDYDD